MTGLTGHHTRHLLEITAVRERDIGFLYPTSIMARVLVVVVAARE